MLPALAALMLLCGLIRLLLPAADGPAAGLQTFLILSVLVAFLVHHCTLPVGRHSRHPS